MTSSSIVPDWHKPLPPTVDRAQAEQFATLLFGGMAGYVALRGIASVPGPTAPLPYQCWLPIDDALPSAMGDYVEMCATNGYAAYVLPHPVRDGGGGLSHILAQRVIPIDFDDGDIAAKVAAINAALGEPWLTIESGGEKNGQRKVHLYYRLAEDAGPEDFERVRAVRAAIASKFGADTKVGNNPAQLLRVPGSEHVKPHQAPAPCRLVQVNAESGAALSGLEAAVGTAPSATSNVLDLNAYKPSAHDVNRVLTQPILAEGASPDGLTRFDAAGKAVGHYIRQVRDGRLTPDEAWQQVCCWNAAEMRPPWDEDRLRKDFERLVRLDREKNGPFASAVIDQDAPRFFKLSDWSTRRYSGKAPEQRWLVDHVFPLGDAGIVAGEGGIGKSFVALDLCFRVAGFEKPSPGIIDLNRTEVFGGQLCEGGSAAFITAEESEAALHRRLEALDPYNRRDALRDKLFVVSLRELGGSGSFIGGKSQGHAMTEYARQTLAELKTKPDLRLVVFDPLAVFFGGEGNDRAAVQAFANVLNHMASETGATVIALHHMRKDSEGGSSRKNILGSSGFVDAFRFAYTLQKQPDKEVAKLAVDYGLQPEHGELVGGQLVKANGSPEGGEHVFERQTNGVLKQLPRRIDIAMAENEKRLALLIGAANWYADYGQPFTKTGRGSGLFANKHALPLDLRGLSQRDLERLAQEAVNRGLLQVASAGREKRQAWLCKPDSKVALGNLTEFRAGARPTWEARESV